MPWYIHAYHAAWALSLALVAYFFGLTAGLAYLCSIAIAAIILNT